MHLMVDGPNTVPCGEPVRDGIIGPILAIYSLSPNLRAEWFDG